MIKITRKLHTRILADLNRPHLFASERIGFLMCRSFRAGEVTDFACFDYLPVFDDDYVEDEFVGARINGNAIRAAMEIALLRKCSVFHVHTHGGSSTPAPSWTDNEECPGVAQSIHNALPQVPHGWMIIGNRGVFAEVLDSSKNWSRFDEMGIVGLPMTTPEKTTLQGSVFRVKRRLQQHSHYARQGFLGSNSISLIENTRIGIIGLGGGGSHVVQQLAHLGFQRFVLCDPDVVEHSNLNRLVGATCHDARRKRAKVDVAARVIHGLRKPSEVRAHESVWQSCLNDIVLCDIVIGCVDSFEQRSSIEAYCRRHLIPYVDMGMEVRRVNEDHHEIYGQVVLSLPGQACLQCAQVITEKTLDKEVQDYGQAGPQPQVVWPNGILASTAVGLCISLVTGWSGVKELPIRLDFRGSSGLVSESGIWQLLRGVICPHYPLEQAGKPVYKAV